MFDVKEREEDCTQFCGSGTTLTDYDDDNDDASDDYNDDDIHDYDYHESDILGQ